MNNQLTLLNEIYKPLYESTKKILSTIKKSGYKAEWGYYGFHSVKKGNEFTTEYFPIPVISISIGCDIGIDIDRIFVEGKLNKESALNFDFHTLAKYNFDVYGVKDYLIDFYNETMEISSINERIKNSTESPIAVSIYLEKHVDMQEILNIITIFNND